MDVSRFRGYAASLGAALVSVCATCFFTVGWDWGALVNRLFDDGDFITVLWTVDAIGRNVSNNVPIADLPMFFPNQGVLFFSGHLLMPAVFYNFFKAFLGDPVLTFNVTLLCFLLLNFWAMFFFCRNFVGRIGAVLGATLFAYSSLRLSQIGHPQIMAQFFLPLLGHFIFKYEQGGRLRDLLFAVVCLVGQFYMGIYQGMISGLVLLPYLVLRCCFVSGRRRWAGHLSLGAGLWVLLMLPLGIPYWKVMTSRHVERPLSEAHVYGAHLTHFFAAPEGALWHSVTEPYLRAKHHMMGKRLFVGFAAILFAIFGFRYLSRHTGSQKRFVLWLTGTTLIFLIWMSHGPQASLYTIFHTYLPGFKAMRAPSRIAFGYLFVMASLVALGAHALAEHRAKWAPAVLGFLALLLVIENKIRLDKKTPPQALAGVSQFLAKGSGPLAHLPLSGYINGRLFASLTHGRVLYNGESAFVPEPQASAFAEEKQDGPSPQLLSRVRSLGITDFVVRRGHAWEPVLQAACPDAPLYQDSAYAVRRCAP